MDQFAILYSSAIGATLGVILGNILFYGFSSWFDHDDD